VSDRRRFRRFFRLAPRTNERTREQMDDEIRFHIEERVDQLVRRGLTPDQALAEARRRFGGAGRDDTFDEARRRLHESARRREDRMQFRDRIEALAQDVRYALRGVRNHPGVTTAIVLTLALGIGANTAMFSVVNGVILRPLPYAHADRVVVVWNRWTSWPKTWLSGPEVVDYSRQREAFDAFAAFDYTAVNLGGDRGEPERLRAGLIARELLDVVGVRPAIGRGFTAEEDAPNGPEAVLLSDELWRRRYAGDRSVVGTRIAINGTPQTVVGVLPAGFRLPIEFAGEHSQLYVPLRLGIPDENNRGSHGLHAVARLRGGVSAEAAERHMNGFIQRFRRDHPHSYGPDFGVVLVPVRDEVLGDVRRILLVLLGAVSFVLLIGCANIANLLLSRAESRHREVAIRAALGAGRGRLVRQLLTESLVLALLGGALGLAVARAGIAALGALGPANLPRVSDVALDPWVLAYTLAVSLACGLAFGLAPAVHAARGDLHHSLRRGRGTTSAGRQRLRHLLVTAEVALAVVSVTGATLMARSFASLLRVPPGFRTDHALTMRVSLPTGRYATSSRVRDAYDALLGEVRQLPGVRSAGAIMGLPLAVTLGDWSFSIEGKAPPGPGQHGPAADWQVATPGYFEAMGIPLRRGRLLTAADRLPGRAVVVINETAARLFWPGEDPIRKRLRLGGGADTLPREIVGVVGDVKHKGVDQETRAEMYMPHAQFPSAVPDSAGAAPRAMTLVIRTDGDPARLTAAVRAIVGRMDPELPVAQVRTLDEVFSASVSTPRFATVLLGAFGGLALVLAALGVYGVISYSVAQRSQEMGIRMALGARAADVVRLVVMQGMRPATIGLILGVLAAVAGTRLMREFLFGVSETDAASFAIGVLVLGVAGLVATVIPARRATRADPLTALRTD
jgi:putative ABC transport system permease protein